MYFDFKTPFKYRIENWLLHWIELFSSIVVILEFCFFITNMGSIRFCWFQEEE